MKTIKGQLDSKITPLISDNSLMGKLKKQVESEFSFVMGMIDEGVINDGSGIKSVHEDENFIIKIDIDIK